MEISNADTRFTAIGLSGSGKTCYILGLYATMAVGVNGFALTTQNHIASKLEDWCEQLNEEKRFPVGTSLNEVSNYGFTLAYKGKKIETIDWIDYGGGILRDKGVKLPEVFQTLQTSIETSAAMYIFIDGTHLCYEKLVDKVKNVKKKCAIYVNSFIQDFSNAHNECFPPIVFVITKADLCARYIMEGELEAIIKECFSPVFSENSTVYITSVSLGINISDDNYSGEFAPENMQIPFFLGLYHDYYDFYKCVEEKIQAQMNNLSGELNKANSELHAHNKKIIKTKNTKQRIDYCESQISQINNNIEVLKQTLENYRKLLKAVSDQLLRDSKDFVVFKNGQKLDTFEPEIF